MKNSKMTNAEWCVKNNIKFKEIHVPYDTKTKEAKIIYRNKEIGRSNNCDTSFTALKTWLDMEHVEPILDDVEKRYLGAVVKPFRDDVQYIVKYAGKFSSRAYEEIQIRYNDRMCEDKHSFSLPRFDKGAMYKGMEVNRHYTLRELGL